MAECHKVPIQFNPITLNSKAPNMIARKSEQKQEPKCALCRDGGHQKSKDVGGEKQEHGIVSVGKEELDAF